MEAEQKMTRSPYRRGILLAVPILLAAVSACRPRGFYPIQALTKYDVIWDSPSRDASFGDIGLNV
jgi:hypothetical protein